MAQTYYSVLTALPHIPSLFEAKEQPISRYQLERRLSALSMEDQVTLSMIDDLIHWTGSPVEADSKMLVKAASRLQVRVKSRALKDLINWRLDLRTVTAALRRKRSGLKAPEAPAWSFGTRHEFIRRNWNAPYFNLEFAFPFLPDLARCLEQKLSYQAEKILFQAVWDQLDRFAGEPGFDFDAVVTYFMRWSLVSRWNTYVAQDAQTRFDNLVNEALDQYDTSIRIEGV